MNFLDFWHTYAPLETQEDAGRLYRIAEGILAATGKRRTWLLHLSQFMLAYAVASLEAEGAPDPTPGRQAESERNESAHAHCN